MADDERLARHSRPRWSPDGQTIAFSFPDIADVHFGITTVRLDGSAEAFVSGSNHDESWPYWSPDGTRLAFPRGTPWPYVRLVVADALDGWVTTEVASEPLAYSAPVVWSPDGTRLIGFPADLTTPVSWASDLPASDGIAILDASGTSGAEPVIIDASSPLFSASWQRLAP